MNTLDQTICLCMIVKNEAPTIRRCLDSVKAIINCWVIVDTGSTDGTQDIIRANMHHIPGRIYERPWQNFAYNRSEALALARDQADYSFIIDADDTLEIEPGFTMPNLVADSYRIEFLDTPVRYWRPSMVRNALPWRYDGVLHEFLTCESAQADQPLSGIRIWRNHDGARRRNPETYRNDIAVLEQALQAEANPFLISRYRFYLAQSYRDSGDVAKALENYLDRAEMGFWQEEVFISLYNAAQLEEQLGYPEQEVIDTYLRASDAVPTRAEALHGASRFCRSKGRNLEGFQMAKRGLAIFPPSNALFAEPWIYEIGLLDELAVNGYWCGRYRESLDASLKLLVSGSCPANQRERIAANAQAALDKLPRDINLGSLGFEGLVEQHALVQPRPLRSHLNELPRVLVAILAKQKELSLPLYLQCIEALDYPKSSIVLYIRTNNNTDGTERILREWVERIGHLYADVEFDAEDVATRVEQFRVHEWNAARFRVLGHIRNISLRRTLENECDFYFVTDIDNFVRPCTLRELVALNLPIAAPLLRSIGSGQFYSNYHAEIDANGYYKECDQYHWILNRWIRGVLEMPLVHCTYLVRADVLNDLTYQDETSRHEYVIFSESARRSNVLQYLDNRQVYGYITFDESDSQYVAGGIEQARALLDIELCVRAKAEEQPITHSKPAKTLVFCTSFATTKEQWDERYRRWLRAIQASQLIYDSILIVDDGSPVLPVWPDVEIQTDGVGNTPSAELLIYHFREHLGRRAVFDFPGWYRSFTFAGRYAYANGFDKVIHIESDSFLIGSRIQRHFNNLTSGWTALWCGLYQGYPESAIQVIAGDAVRRFAEIERTHPHEQLVGREFELQLPFDVIEKRFNGNRYGEYLQFVPGNAEYAVQVQSGRSSDYYWWMQGEKDDKISPDAERIVRAETDRCES